MADAQFVGEPRGQLHRPRQPSNVTAT
jgi:hypothetical protein